MTYYGTGAGGTGFTAMDVSDPAHPKLIGHYAEEMDSTHDISISKDGKRAYLTRWGNFVPFGLPGPNGLVILDTSDIQARDAGFPPRVVGQYYWEDGGTAQQTIPVTFKGKPSHHLHRRVWVRAAPITSGFPLRGVPARDIATRLRADHRHQRRDGPQARLQADAGGQRSGELRQVPQRLPDGHLCARQLRLLVPLLHTGHEDRPEDPGVRLLGRGPPGVRHPRSLQAEGDRVLQAARAADKVSPA